MSSKYNWRMYTDIGSGTYVDLWLVVNDFYVCVSPCPCLSHVLSLCRVLDLSLVLVL